MYCLFHRYWHTSVCRDSKELITGKTDYCDTMREMTASMTMDVYKLLIQKAVLRRHRGPNGEEIGEQQSIPGLQGVCAYLGSGAELGMGLIQVRDSLGASLFVETVRGVIQAESYLHEERGYASPEEYCQYWEGMYKGSCRYYSNLDRISRSWSEYAGCNKREVELFVRYKSQHLCEFDPDSYFIMSTLSDTFHEINACLIIDKQNGNIVSVEGSFTRVPDNVCCESTDYLSQLPGRDITSLSKKEIAGLLGKGQGCVHLIDVVHDAAEILRLFQHTL